MIDTIHLRVAGLGETSPAYGGTKIRHPNRALFEYLARIKNGSSTRLQELKPNTIILDDEATTFNSLSFPTVWNKNTGAIQADYVELDNNRKVTTYFDTKKEQEHTLRGFLKLPSYHYEIAFSLTSEHVDFNLSIPKYLYGTNVVQFIDDFTTPGFKLSRDKAEFSHVRKGMYKKLMSVIKEFFQYNFVGIEIDYTYVQIMRVDLCYNLVLPTKKEAMEYMDNCLHIRKRYARKDTLDFQTMDGNLFIKSDSGYSFKMYRKGEEFRKHDAKELAKFNQTAGAKIVDIDLLQRLADRTIRYECTFRTPFMSYLFMKYCFREKCPYHQKRIAYYKAVSKKLRLEQFTDDELSKRSRPPYSRAQLDITRNQRQFHQRFTNLLSRSVKFTVAISPWSRGEYYYKNTNLLEAGVGVDYWPTNKSFPFQEDLKFKKGESLPDCVFSPRLFKVMAEYFNSMCNEFKLEKRPTVLDFVQRCQAYNREIDQSRKLSKSLGFPLTKKKKLQINKYSMIIALIERGESLDTICETHRIPRSTKHDIKQALLRVGYTSKSVVPFDYEIDFSFMPYYLEIAKILPQLYKVKTFAPNKPIFDFMRLKSYA